jgi:hypothetical protein
MKNKDKVLLDALGERYDVIEHDGGYCLYDKERPAKRSMHKYIGMFFISTDKKRYSFNDNYYKDVESLVKAMDDYNATLPFDTDIYCPIFKKSYRIEIALFDYLESLGFEREWGGERRYFKNDCFGQCICDLTVQVEEGTTKGVIRRSIITSDEYRIQFTDSPFTDLDSAIASVNTILATYVASVDAAAMDILNKITHSRSALLLDTTFDVRTLSKFTEDGRMKMIEVLEKELEQLKGISKKEETK